jgi:hypothetical protein
MTLFVSPGKSSFTWEKSQALKAMPSELKNQRTVSPWFREDARLGCVTPNDAFRNGFGRDGIAFYYATH